jgi:two-component system sensor histidine kinase VicK
LASLEDLEKLKSEFISTVSHELRTPLAITKQLVGLLDSTASASSRRQIMQKIKHNLDRLQATFDKLLDVSRIENKRLKLQYTLVNLNDLIRESQDYFRRLAEEKNIQCVYRLTKHDVNLFIDADRIYQVILNLMTNAIKFTEENGGVTLEVRILEQKVRIGVIDTGVGIAKADLHKIFEKFVQLAGDESARRKGIGLGLTIVKEIVEQHGGEIWVESRPGVGRGQDAALPPTLAEGRSPDSAAAAEAGAGRRQPKRRRAAASTC